MKEIFLEKNTTYQVRNEYPTKKSTNKKDQRNIEKHANYRENHHPNVNKNITYYLEIHM